MKIFLLSLSVALVTASLSHTPLSTAQLQQTVVDIASLLTFIEPARAQSCSVRDPPYESEKRYLEMQLREANRRVEGLAVERARPEQLDAAKFNATSIQKQLEALMQGRAAREAQLCQVMPR